jgi:nicotinate dehydrogenase subunit A
MTISTIVNGNPVAIESPPGIPLLLCLRNELGLNSPRYGCGKEQCGACRVLVDGELKYSCTLETGEVEGKAVLTVEGLAGNDQLHPLQEAFLALNAGQCGYCLSGILIAAYELLVRIPQPKRQEIKTALKDNLCRCGAHNRIIRAIQQAAGSAEEN